jgi:hypothetical protein
MNLPAKRATLRDLALPGRPLGEAADIYLARLQRIHTATGHDREALERLVAEALTAGGAVVEVGPRYGPEERPDLVLWHDELESTLGNPLVIEVRYRLSDPVGAARQLASYMEAAGTTWGLLLFVDDDVARSVTRRALAPGVLAFAIRDLLIELRDASLPQVITRERNRIMHGID